MLRREASGGLPEASDGRPVGPIEGKNSHLEEREAAPGSLDA
jgi:hypothetical protein